MAREEFYIALKEEEAKQEVLQKGIQILISSLKDLDLSKDAIVLQLQKKISSNKRGSFILSKQINFVVA
jgi:CTP synthase (UTP-ammonia lyase)